MVCLIVLLQSIIMSQITIINVLDKIRSICKDLTFIAMPQKITSEQSITSLQGYLRALQGIRLQFIKYRSMQEEYYKLEQLLQRGQTEIRKRIGIENQLKLISETLKTQLQDLEKQKIDLLENTKTYIKQLKKTNENLFIELNLQINKNKQFHSHSNEKSPSKSRDKISGSKISNRHKSKSQHKAKMDPNIKDIVKTELIGKVHSQSRRKKVRLNNTKRELHETISDNNDNQANEPLHTMQNSKTYQVTRINSTNKKGQDSKKKNNHLYSNPNFYSFFDTSKKKAKKQQKSMFVKSPSKQKKKNAASRIQNASKNLWKDKQLNRSIYSVISLEPHSNKKQTI